MSFLCLFSLVSTWFKPLTIFYLVAGRPIEDAAIVQRGQCGESASTDTMSGVI